MNQPEKPSGPKKLLPELSFLPDADSVCGWDSEGPGPGTAEGSSAVTISQSNGASEKGMEILRNREIKKNSTEIHL